jgi:hypothetical protein
MILRRMKDPQQALFSAAMVCLAFGGIIAMLLRHNAPLTPLWDKLGDGLTGMFYGMAIALVFLAARFKARRDGSVC